MSNAYPITEAITQKEYDQSMSDENYNVVFGFTYTGSNKVISAEKSRYDNHIWLQTNSDVAVDIAKMGDAPHKNWRYVTITKTIYWWDRCNSAEDQATINHLKSKYNYDTEHRVFVDTELTNAKMTSQQKNKRDVMFTTGHNAGMWKHFGGTIPSFKDWYNAHIGD